jgi:prepilin peptidase CpaA
MLATALLLVLVLIATATDLHSHKIYNWTTYSGIVAALALNGFGDLLLAGGVVTEQQLWAWGWIGTDGGLGAVQSFAGLIVCGLLMLVCYVMFRIGGGDVKLIAMLGAFLGPESGIMAMLWTFVLGGCMGVIVLIWRVGPVRLVARCWRQLVTTLRLRRWCPLGEEERAQLQPPLFLAPCALVAVVIVRFSLV